MARKRIGVVPFAEYEAYQGLFLVLSSLFPVEFRKSERNSYAGLDGLRVFNGTREAGIRAAKAGIRCHVVLNSGAKPVNCGSANVDFSRAANLHPYFQNQTLVDEDAKEFVPLSPLPGDEIVASRAGRVLWIYRHEGKSGVDFVAVGPPGLGAQVRFNPPLMGWKSKRADRGYC